jgi:TonB family protein
MEIYLFKSSLSLIVLYGMYKIMVKREFDHQFNRVVGLSCLAFSMIFPFVRFTPVDQASQLPSILMEAAKQTAGLQNSVSSAIPGQAEDIILGLYVAGVLFFSIRALFGVGMLFYFYSTSPKAPYQGFTLVRVNKQISPFTFFNFLFVGKERMDDEEMSTMLMHEQTHRRHGHSVDTLFLELVTILFWFNPVIWLFQQDIKAEHEYMADRQVLAGGVALLDYQHTLFKIRTGISIDLGSYLNNKTSLTKRFNMMAKTKSNPTGRIMKASFFAASMSILLFFGAFTDRPNQVDKVASYAEGEAAMYKVLRQQMRYPASARNENRSGTVRVSFTITEKGVIENVSTKPTEEGYLLQEIVVVGFTKAAGKAKGIDDALEAEGVRAVSTLGNFHPARKDGKAVSSILTLPIKFQIGK